MIRTHVPSLGSAQAVLRPVLSPPHSLPDLPVAASRQGGTTPHGPAQNNSAVGEATKRDVLNADTELVRAAVDEHYVRSGRNTKCNMDIPNHNGNPFRKSVFIDVDT